MIGIQPVHIRCRGIQMSEKVLGTTHPDTLMLVGNLGVLLTGQDKLEEAETLLQRNLDGQVTLSGAEHQDTLNARGNLGLLLTERSLKRNNRHLFVRTHFLTYVIFAVFLDIISSSFDIFDSPGPAPLFEPSFVLTFLLSLSLSFLFLVVLLFPHKCAFFK